MHLERRGAKHADVLNARFCATSLLCFLAQQIRERPNTEQSVLNWTIPI